MQHYCVIKVNTLYCNNECQKNFLYFVSVSLFFLFLLSECSIYKGPNAYWMEYTPLLFTHSVMEDFQLVWNLCSNYDYCSKQPPVGYNNVKFSLQCGNIMKGLVKHFALWYETIGKDQNLILQLIESESFAFDCNFLLFFFFLLLFKVNVTVLIISSFKMSRMTWLL